MKKKEKSKLFFIETSIDEANFTTSVEQNIKLQKWYKETCVLTLKIDVETHPIAYTSRKLSEAERKYVTIEKVLLVVKHALKTWRVYLHGSNFIINSDHHPLKYLEAQKMFSRKQERCVEFKQEFNYEIKI